MEDHKNIQKFAKFYAQYSTIWSKQRGEKTLKLFEEHNIIEGMFRVKYIL